MTGAELRMQRLFGKESGRAYVVAIDHGMLFGVLEGSEDAITAVERSLNTDPDGLFISPGLLARTGHLLAHRGAASPIVRLDYLTLDERSKPYGDKHRMLCSPTQAAKLGADAVVMYLMFGSADGETFADNLSAIGQAVDEAHEQGLPLIAEVVAWGSHAVHRRDTDLLTYGVRLAVEIGADMIKTEYTGDPESMTRLVSGCPAPVLMLGGAKADSVDALLAATRDALSVGVAGVIYGRNIWQADDPAGVGAAVRSLVHEQR
jgi:DhnA family fructose-bisphosphate aldolase class Ia